MYTYICVFTMRLYVCFIVQRTQHKNSFLVFNVLSISPPVSFSKKKKKGDNNPRTYTHIRIKINSQLYNFSHASFTLSIVSIN